MILSVLIFLLSEVKRSLLGAMLTIVYVGLILVSLDASIRAVTMSSQVLIDAQMYR